MNRTELESAIQQLEQHRGTLPEEVIDTSIRALRAQLDSLNRKQESNERLHATVLFIDLAGFTAWSEKLDPEVVTETLNRLWTVLDGIVIESGGVVDKHIGDCLMALWGVDTVREDNAEQAVKAALMMHERLGLFCIQENITLRARIGVHTGAILWGSIGSNAEQTAMGDAVNLASRLEHACPIGKVLISGDTYRLVKGVFDVTPQEPLSVKGKESPIKTYLVERTKPRAFRSGVRGLDSGETPFTGRAEESRLLKGFFHAVVHNDKKIMATIEGEAGIGKSRLLREFEDWTELQTDVYYIFRGRCDQSFENRPWSLLKDILTFRFEIPEAGSPNEIINALQDGLSKIWIPETAKEAVPWLAALVGWTNGSKLTADPQILANKAIEYFYDLIAYLCYVHPVVFFLEDIHWADHGSLGIFETLMDSPNQKAVLIVANCRPDLFERHPTWGKDRIWHKKLKLKPLGEPELLQILDVLLDNTGWKQDSIKKQIADSTAGNPFFVEEMVQCLKDQEPF